MPLPEDISGGLPPGNSITLGTILSDYQANYATPTPTIVGGQHAADIPFGVGAGINSIWGGQNVERTRFIPMVED